VAGAVPEGAGASSGLRHTAYAAAGDALHHAEVAVMKRLYVQDRNKFRAAVLLAALLLGCGLYFTWPQLKRLFVTETSDVATQLLSGKELQQQASVFAKAVLHETLNDPLIFKEATSFVHTLLTSEATQATIQAVIANTMRDPATKAELQRASDGLVKWLLADPAIRAQLIELLVWLVAQPYTQTMLIDLVNRSLVDPAFRDFAVGYGASFFQSLFSDEALKASAIQWLWDLLGEWWSVAVGHPG